MIKSYNAKQWEIPLLLDGRKTAIRCIIPGKVVLKPEMEHEVTFFPYKCRKDNGQEIKCIRYFTRESFMKYEAPHQPGDILYVREQWEQTTDLLGDPSQYIYQADWGELDSTTWRPSSCMPKEAVRLFLQVINVRAEQLQDTTEEQAKAEGFSCKDEFIKAFRKMYPNCTEESWVWVIEFERCEKPEPCIIRGGEPADDERPCIGYSVSEDDDEPCEMRKGCKICTGKLDYPNTLKELQKEIEINYKQTNADRIRSMSDEELAELITSGELSAICPFCKYYGTEDCYMEKSGAHKNCSRGIIKWLQSEWRDNIWQY